eukprot:gene2455-2828_t
MPNDAQIDVDGSLIFQDIKTEDSGAYSCTAKNKVGSMQATMILFVQDATFKDCKELYAADNDQSGGNCARSYHGAWWYMYRGCHYSNLNGLHPSKGVVSTASGISWYTWKGKYDTIKFSEMKLR